MMIRRLVTGKIAAITAAGAVAVGGLAIAGSVLPASANGSTPTASTTASPAAGAAAKARHPRLKIARSVVHGQFTAKTKDGYAVFDAQRGDVTAVSTTSITIKSPDGFSATYVVNGATAVRDAGKKASISAVTTGEKAVVVAKVNGSTATATHIVARAG